jgi:hypothetical protein
MPPLRLDQAREEIICVCFGQSGSNRSPLLYRHAEIMWFVWDRKSSFALSRGFYQHGSGGALPTQAL